MTLASQLPWTPGSFPLMLAPMQGLTNRALRGLFVERYRPDVVFTEYVLVKTDRGEPISRSDRQEVGAAEGGVPLIVQLIGGDPEAMLAAARAVQELGAAHLNINLGCPYGRMARKVAGGTLLGEPEQLATLLKLLRPAIRGSFSVKARSGVDDPGQLPRLVELFEECGVDFLIVHPRTVRQRYNGPADHRVTAEVVRRTRLPVIANGDIFTEEDGRRVRAQTGAAGLMLGRGAIADPFLFRRLRSDYPAVSHPELKAAEVRDYLLALLARYEELFCGEQQVLYKMKEVVSQMQALEAIEGTHRLLRCRKLAHFTGLLRDLA
ncbi:MAG: tRNA dihydrouridine synthase [Desulfobulbaceae bacterium]|jgi:tRNA-dihydrouridine synthase